jgi:hypothetical protein
VGIVGCGYQGGILAQTIVKGNGRITDALRIVACADPDQAANMSAILVVGATGRLGSEICRRLTAVGKPIGADLAGAPHRRTQCVSQRRTK